MAARSPRPRRGGREEEEGAGKEEAGGGTSDELWKGAGGGGAGETLPWLSPRGLGVTGCEAPRRLGTGGVSVRVRARAGVCVSKRGGEGGNALIFF